MKKPLTLLTLLLIPFFGNAQTIDKFSIDSGGASATAGNIQILYTIGEVNIQELAAGTLQVSEGFINPTQLSITVNAKVFLQGPIDNPTTAGLMNDDLRANTLIPTTSPYSDELVTTAAVLNVTGTDAIVDWVWLELRDATDRTIVIEGHSALLQRDGNIVAVDGLTAVSFNASENNYYLRIQHRNHLSILSATPIAIAGTTAVDLSSDPIDVFGGIAALASLNGVFAMVAGDALPNGQIQTLDANTVLPQAGTSGYTNLDVDMNGQVQISDINLYILPNNGRGIQF